MLARAGYEIHYWVTGPSDGPLVVLTHGALLDHTSYDAQLAPLTSAGHRVVTWDLRGHGRSQPIGERCSAAAAAEDLLAVIDALGCASATLVGVSFGGYVVQEAVFRHPERVDAVVIVGCTDLGVQPALVMRIALRVVPWMLPLFRVGTFRRRAVADLSVHDEIRHRAYEATASLSKRDFIQIVTAGVDCLGSDAGRPVDYTIPRPFLLLHGELDTANGGVFTKTAPAWAHKEPRCTYAVIPNAGHTANQDDPDAFNAVLLAFLQRHAVGRRA